MKKRTSQLSLAVFSLTLLVISIASSAQERHVVNLSGTNGLPFSDGVVVGNTLYLSGQQGNDDKGKLPAGGIGPETQATLQNLEKVIKAAGFQLKDIVAVNVYLADMHEFGDMNKVYKAFLPDPKPTRTTIQAAALVNNARVEISAIAVKGK